MPAGMRVFNPDGSIQTDVTTNMSRVLGVVNINFVPGGPYSGYITHPAFGTYGRPWFFFLGFNGSYAMAQPILSVASDRINWRYETSDPWWPGSGFTCPVLIGVF